MRARFTPVFLIVFGASDFAPAADLKTNAQLWSELDLKASLSSNWSATLLTISREGDGLPNPALMAGGLIVDYHLGNWTLSAGDLEAVARNPRSGARLDVNLPLASFTYSWHLGDFHISDRNRVEDLDGVPGNPWRYRNRVSVEHTVTGLGPVSSVFVTDEAFLDLQTVQWTRNRTQLGFTVDIARRAQLQLYYLRQDDRVALPSAINALGTTLVIELP